MSIHLICRRFPLLAVLDPGWCADWLGSGENLALDLGHTLFQAGTPGEFAYMVAEGRVRVLRPAPSGREISLGSYGPTDLFGEYALLPPGRNTATCRAGAPSRVVRLPLAPLRQAVATMPQVHARLKMWLRLHAVLGYLRDGSFLGFLSAPSVITLADRCEPTAYRAEQTIQADGLNADRWFVIRSGQVHIHPEPGGRSAEPLVLGPGDCFGAHALLGNSALPLAEAAAATTCLALRRAAFHQSLHGSQPAQVEEQTGGIVFDSVKPSLPWVGQEETADCGAAALTMIARFHGLTTALAEVRSRLRLDNRGASLADLQQAAVGLGFRAQAVRAGLEQLMDVRMPAVAHWIDGHYVVLYAVGAEGLLVGDPASGVITLNPLRFRKAWSGNLLLVTPTGRKSQVCF